MAAPHRPISAGGLLAALLVVGPAPACRVAPPQAEDWIAIGHRSPEQCFATFQTGLAADRPDLEYRCLSGRFKHANHLSELAWREYRERMLDETPGLRRLAGAQVLEFKRISDREAEILAEVRWPFGSARVRFGFVREDFWEAWSGRTLLGDDLVSFEQVLSVDSGGARIAIPALSSFSGLTELRVGQEWKIDAIEPLPES